MNNQNLTTIVIGGLNTDIVALGVKKIIQAGEHIYGKRLKIGPGGKSRNIAQMIATLRGKNTVAMIGRTSKDPYGLWKFPIEALKKAGVNTQYIKILKSKEFPGIALIAVDRQGRNQIYVLPGITNSFSPIDIDDSNEIFTTVAKNKGNLVFSLELPLETAIYAVKKANSLGIRVLFDPGGIDKDQNYSNLLKQKIFLIKPNEHEAKILTGVTVDSFQSAKKAAAILLKQGIEHVFITTGKTGGYLFNKTLQKHIPVPDVKGSLVKDETGCGDQTIATIAAQLCEGKDIEEAATIGILSGTLEFHKNGIVSITKKELRSQI